jgi:hypothetical protein
MRKRLSELARKKRNEYVREWRARNKEKVRESNRLYWERRAEKEDNQDNFCDGGETK